MRAWLVLVLLGVFLRIFVVAFAGNQARAAWSGGGDTQVYVLLAQNLLQGKGLSYAGQPTALRAPGYPLLLAGFLSLLGSNYAVGLRSLQLLLGLATTVLCWRSSAMAFGEAAGRATLVIALFFPTLVYVTGEILTECVGASMAALFLYLMVQAFHRPSSSILVSLGLVCGAAALFRFNMAALLFIALWVAIAVKSPLLIWQRLLLVALSAALVVSPWLIRNQIDFHGDVLYSTLAGHDAVEGVVAPQGRALSGDAQRIQSAEGWVLSDVETNDSSRMRFPSEANLNRNAWHAAVGLWQQWRFKLIPLEAKKLAFFWLSLDQVFWTNSFTFTQRSMRVAGVVVYWVLLSLAIMGWLKARHLAPRLARGFLLYAVCMTALHLPFPMITRLRIPLMDPLIAILAGASLSALTSWPERKSSYLAQSIPPVLS